MFSVSPTDPIQLPHVPLTTLLRQQRVSISNYSLHRFISPSFSLLFLFMLCFVLILPLFASHLATDSWVRGNVGGISQCKQAITWVQAQCLMLALAAVWLCPALRLSTHTHTPE